MDRDDSGASLKAQVGIQTESEDYKQFIEKLEQIKARDVAGDGKVKVIAKDEIKEHLGRSPSPRTTLHKSAADLWISVKPL